MGTGLSIVGRADELASLHDSLGRAIEGSGSALIISGQPGIGKTRLVQELCGSAASRGAALLSGAALAGSAQPFSAFSRALASHISEPIFDDRERVGFAEIFAVNKSGLLLAKASSEEGGLDPDIFAGMLSAVQDFVRDSFSATGGGKSSLGKLEYGDLKILIEHGEHIFLASVVKGTEYPDMKGFLRQALLKIEREHGPLLTSWTGRTSEMRPVEDEVAKLAEARFMVRIELEGAKLQKERLRISDKVLGIIAALSSKKPTLLLLEDLQWLDESSLFVFQYLARNLGELPVLLVGTCRPEESQSLDAAVESMKGEKIIEEMKLEPLKPAAVSDMISALCPDHDLPGEFIDGLSERCEGTPLFIIEFIRHMIADGTIAQKDGRYGLTRSAYSIPDTVEEVIHWRLGKLSHEALALAEYASCMGREFPTELVGSLPLLADTGVPLTELAQYGLLEIHEGGYAFTHALYPEIIYSTLSPRWRRAHHRSIGEYFEDAYQDRMDDAIFELARHFHSAAEHRKAAKYCMLAGEKAESAYAPTQALSLYQNALEAMKSLGIPREESQAAVEKIGDMRFLTGMYKEAMESFEEVSKASESAEVKARMMRKCSESEYKTANAEKALALLAEAKRIIADEEHVEYARICANEAFILDQKGKSEIALELLAKANLIFAREAKELKYSGTVQRWMGLANQHLGRLEKALEHFKEALRIAERSGEPEDKAAVLNSLGVVYADMGEFDKAIQHYQESLAMTASSGDIDSSSIALSNIGNIYFLTGELDKAIEYQVNSLKLKKRIGRRWGIAASTLNLGVVCLCKGDLGEAMGYYEEALALWESMKDKRGMTFALNNMGELHLLAGELDKALDCYSRTLEIREGIGDKVWLVSTLCGLAQTYLARGDGDTAMKHADRALEISLEMKVREKEGISRRAIGMIQREGSDLAEAEKNLEASITILMEVKNRAELGIAMYERSLLLKSAGRTAEARESFGRTLTMFEGLGMKLWAGRCKIALEAFTPPQ